MGPSDGGGQDEIFESRAVCGWVMVDRSEVKGEEAASEGKS